MRSSAESCLVPQLGNEGRKCVVFALTHVYNKAHASVINYQKYRYFFMFYAVLHRGFLLHSQQKVSLSKLCIVYNVDIWISVIMLM